MFRLHSGQIFAINVFKVKEVITLPKLNAMPGSHHNLKGVTNYRGTSIPIIDLRRAICMPEKPIEGAQNVVITEYNRSVQGFLIGEILTIVNTSWQEIQPPPSNIGKSAYLTAITQVEVDGIKRLVEIIDVEKVLAEIIDYITDVSPEVIDQQVISHMKGQKVLIVDDSPTARAQIRDTLSQFGIEVIEQNDGLKALKMLKKWADEGKKVTDEILLMFTDAEMPEMDGYSLTAEVRNDPRMADLFIALNTSLSGSFNEAMVEKVGCNRFISKFQPDLLIDVAQQRMREVLGIKPAQ